MWVSDTLSRELILVKREEIVFEELDFLFEVFKFKQVIRELILLGLVLDVFLIIGLTLVPLSDCDDFEQCVEFFDG